MKLMKNLVFLGLLMLTVLSCDKDDNTPIDRVAHDDELIMNYLAANNITAIKHESGLYYTVDQEGDGSHPNANSLVTVKYEGYLLDGSVFDGNDRYTFDLSGNLITGWKIGIPLFSKGGSGTIYIPSYYGYGSQNLGAIPSHSVLVFDIELFDFK